MISTLVAGMLPLMGSKSRTVAVASSTLSTLSMTSPSMRAGEPGQLPALRESLWRRWLGAGEPERSSRASRSRYGPHTAPKCGQSDGKQHGKFTGRLRRRGGRVLVRAESGSGSPGCALSAATSELRCSAAQRLSCSVAELRLKK